jgi:competence ComEA-like helix-hairpin-helix protein
MWKDFFYFSKGQQIGIIVLLVLILLVTALRITLPYLLPSTSDAFDTTFVAKAETFKKSLLSLDSIQQAERQRQFEERYATYKFNYQKDFSNKTAHYSLFNFDPNTADSATFVQLGLKSYVASNILKYRSKGGLFKNKEDFSKIYGISPDKLNELLPYIQIDEKFSASSSRSDIKVVKENPSSPIELNSADTAQLMQVKGIGRYYAKSIVRFRQETGGFFSVEQLSEIYGMTPENLEKIKPYCTVNPDRIEKIKVNISSVDRLNRHPYISFYQAKAIYELRRKKGKLHQFGELKNLPEFTEEQLKKIEPYLSFE